MEIAMIFKDAYKEIINGKKMVKSSFIGSDSIKYFCSITVKVFLGDVLLKTDLPFISLCDAKDNIQRVQEASIIQFLLSEDDDWSEYVEPIVCTGCIEDAIVEPIVEA